MNFLRSLFDDSIQSLKLVLDKPNCTYYSGETISGRCLVVLRSALDTDRIEIKFKGDAHTVIRRSTTINVNENGHYRSQSVQQNITENQSLLRQIYWVKNSLGPILSSGSHEIPFQFLLPENVPSTFEYNSCYIRYTISAKFGPIRKEIGINCFTNPNILMNQLYDPVCMENKKSVGILSSKPLHMQCELQRKGITLGSEVLLKCSVNNQTDRPMVLKAIIRQKISIQAQTSQEKHGNKIWTLTGPEIKPKTISQHQLPILIPKQLPICYNTCKLIQIEYFIDVKLAIPMASDLHCQMPVVLTYQNLNQTATFPTPTWPTGNPTVNYIQQFQPQLPQPPTSSQYPTLYPFEESNIVAPSAPPMAPFNNNNNFSSPPSPPPSYYPTLGEVTAEKLPEKH